MDPCGRQERPRTATWILVAGGVAFGVAAVAGYILSSLPPEAGKLMRASYVQAEGGRAGPSGERVVRGAEVRRTPLAPPTDG